VSPEPSPLSGPPPDQPPSPLHASLQLGEIRVLEAISAGAPLPVLLDLIARSVEAIIPEAMASILLLDPDGLHLRHGAGPRLPPAYMQAIDGGEIGPLAGSCGTATYLKQLVIAADIEHDPRWAAYRDLALGFGLRACWSMPVLTTDGTVLATYAVYYALPRAPKPAEVRVLERMASLARIAMERDRKDKLLRESEERFRLLSWATNDAIWDWNLVSDAIWWSEGFETLFGHRRSEVEPTIVSWERRIHPDDQERVITGLRQAIASGRTRWSDEYRFVRKDGTYAHVIDRGQVIHETDGRPVRMVGGITDISERLALEEQVRRAQQLEALGQLTGGVAHDFNNLLTVIIGNAKLLLEELPAEASTRSLTELIAGAAQRGADLTTRLLAFARRQPLDPRPVDVNALVQGMDGLLRRTLGAHIEIRLALADGLWPALVDPAQLDSALLNLCLNARDAMAGGGQLTIATSNTELDEGYAAQYRDVVPGAYVLLAVSDTGVGIPEEHLARVFEPFFTTKETGKGTGMGLAMVFGFMKQSGGHINVSSERGVGTTVRLYLPRVHEVSTGDRFQGELRFSPPLPDDAERTDGP
jgi:PAS domain S-box-containing protein